MYRVIPGTSLLRQINFVISLHKSTKHQRDFSKGILAEVHHDFICEIK